MWQKCPICEGTGIIHGIEGTKKICQTCKSYGIINEITGLPPVYSVEQTKEFKVFPNIVLENPSNPK